MYVCPLQFYIIYLGTHNTLTVCYAMLCVTCIHIYPNQLFLNDTYKMVHTNAGIKTIHTHIHTHS